MAQKIKDVLPSVFENKNSWKMKLLQHWPSIIGKLKSKVRIEKIQKDTLVLGVYDSCWLQELYLLSPVLLSTINEKLENVRFKRLRFKQAGIKKVKRNKKEKEVAKEKKERNLTKKEELTLQRIKDPELEKVLKKFLIRCIQEN